MSKPNFLQMAFREIVTLLECWWACLIEFHERMQRLEHENVLLRRWRWGKRSEKIRPADINQPWLFADFPPSAQPGDARSDDSDKQPRRHRGHGRSKLPTDLPRRRVILEPSEADRTCAGCGDPMCQIGEESSEQLEHIPAIWRILETVRPKYACHRCQDQIVTTAKPPAAIEKCLATPSTLAYVVTSKYADHLPLNRQVGIFARHGVSTLSRSTLCDWVKRTAGALEPLYQLMKEDVLESLVLHVDDTSIGVLDRSYEKTRTAHLWAYVGDDQHPHTVYDYTPDWTNQWPMEFLSDWAGHLQADAYKGYDAIYRQKPWIIEVGCWAHARRKFDEAQTTDKLRAMTAIGFIRQLFRLEREIVEMTPAEKVEQRQARAGPILDAFGAWMKEQEPQILPKSPLAKAIRYSQNQWLALKRYLNKGELSISNNAAERAMRGIAVGRSNWLFAGSDEGGRRAAILYSFVQSCKRHRLDPYAWFCDVLTRLPELSGDELGQLLPAVWSPHSEIAKERVQAVTEERIIRPLSTAA